MSEPLTFVDTNVIVYAHNASEPVKHERARALLEALWRDRAAVTSTQVLTELNSVVTGKLSRPPAAGRDLVLIYATWPIVQTDVPLIVAATERHERDQLSFWDALIVEAALRSGASRLATEDLQSGRRFDGLEIVNPLA